MRIAFFTTFVATAISQISISEALAQNNTAYDQAHSHILCPALDAGTKSKFDEFQISAICRSVRQTRGDRNDNDPFTFVPLTGKPIPPNPFIYSWSGRFVTFNIPNDEGFEDYVLCDVWRRINSEIPGPGKYQKHGLQGQITDRSFTYGWHWTGRPRSLTLGIYIAIIPKSELAKATEAGVCKPLTTMAQNIAWRVSG